MPSNQHKPSTINGGDKVLGDDGLDDVAVMDATLAHQQSVAQQLAGVKPSLATPIQVLL